MKKFDFIKEEFKEEIKPDSLDEKIKSAEINLADEFTMPQFVIKIVILNKWTNIGSLGNFSCITGQAKARKSFARMLFEAASVKNGIIEKTIYVNLPENKRKIIYIDTEQGKSNVSWAGKRIAKMAGVNGIPSNYKVYALREFNYLERCEIIEKIIQSNQDLGIMFIDGIADLAACNNDEIEGNRVAQLLMTWTSKYNIHICTVIHQPRAHGGATGHLGASIEKKAESVIGVSKEKSNSVIESKLIRNDDDFSPIPFAINSEYIPYVIGENQSVLDYYVDKNIDDEEQMPF